MTRRAMFTMSALLLLTLGLMLAPVWAGDVSVNGYTRKDGTYVAPHFRSAPDSSFNNNWSTSPNVNPYTGQQGTHTPRMNDSVIVPTPSPAPMPSWGLSGSGGNGLSGSPSYPLNPYNRR
jgi:hypothetical protein